MNKKFRILALLVLAVVMSAATYGFAAANTVDASVAGEGFGAVSGYDVTGILYQLNASNPSQFDSVTFTLDANATDVYAGIGNGSTVSWGAICAGGPTVFSCNLSSTTITVAAALELHVIAAQ